MSTRSIRTRLAAGVSAALAAGALAAAPPAHAGAVLPAEPPASTAHAASSW